MVDDFFRQPVVVDIVSGANLDGSRGGARGAAPGQWRQGLLAQHQRQHAAGTQEHVQEERLPVQTFWHLHDIQGLVVYCFLHMEQK